MKRKQADLRRRDLFWILGRRSSLSLENKIRIYKTVLLPIICYCAPLWGLASKSNIKKLQAFQNITLRVMTGAPTYVPNEQLHKELNLNAVKDLIMKMTESYKRRLADHINSLASNLGRTTTTTPFHRSYETINRSYEKSNWSYEKGKILAGAYEKTNRSYEKPPKSGRSI